MVDDVYGGLEKEIFWSQLRLIFDVGQKWGCNVVSLSEIQISHGAEIRCLQNFKQDTVLTIEYLEPV
jgi:hypothetical protein